MYPIKKPDDEVSRLAEVARQHNITGASLASRVNESDRANGNSPSFDFGVQSDYPVEDAIRHLLAAQEDGDWIEAIIEGGEPPPR